MNDEQFEGLKRFIDSRISQSEVQFDKKLIGLKTDVEQRFDEVQSAIAESINTTNDGNDKQIKDCERRLIKLEQQAA